MLVELSYKEFQAKLHPRKDPEEGEATAHRVKGWKKPNQPQDRNRKRNRGYRKPIGASINEVAPPSAKHKRMVKHIKKSYKKDGKLTKKEKSIAYATAWKDYRKESAESIHKYEPEGEFLSYEEVEVFVESLVEQGYTEEQILLELDRKGLGPVIFGKGLEYGLGAIKNTIKFGKATRGVVNRAVSDTKLLKKIDTTARTLRGKTGNTFKGFKDRAGAIVNRVKGKLNRTDIKANTPSVTKKPVEVLGGAATTKGGSKTLKNITPKKTQIGNAIKNATDDIKTTATNVGKTAAVTGGLAAVTNLAKKEVKPEKNPVVKKTTGDGGKAAWLKKTSKSPAARSGAFTDDERWNTQLKHRAWKASRQRTKVDENIKDELLSKAAKAHKKAKNFKKWRNEAEKARQTTLKKGEVRWMDKKTGKWKSNKK